MISKLFPSIARRLMRCPAAPFHEHAIREAVQLICGEHQLACGLDRFGNLLIEHRRGGLERPMVLAAHLDHPGFDVLKRLDSRRFHARFLGGVPKLYFRKGARIRLIPGGESARLGIALAGEKEFEILADQPVEIEPQFGVWALNEFAIRKGRIIGRACDDLIGVAAILTTLIELRRSRRNSWVIGVITRAEEIGFGGALALAKSGKLPDDSLVVSLETSKEIPGVKMGRGVIIRVGDRSSVFDSRATRFFHENAVELDKPDAPFLFQRALMAGGSCEGTAFQEAGFQTAALCVALGNYHNCGARSRIAEEFVDRRDAESMVRLLVNAAFRMKSFSTIVGRLPAGLEKIRRASEERLLVSAVIRGNV
jgi:putative aminopeptidase FrvX